jgi:hypothetical protein
MMKKKAANRMLIKRLAAFSILTNRLEFNSGPLFIITFHRLDFFP